MPTILRVGGFRFFFYSNEGQELPHIHVLRGDDQAKFWLVPVQLASAQGFKASTLNKLHVIVRDSEKLF